MSAARLATQTAHAIVLAYGWRRALIALAAGAASVLAMAPFNAWPVLFITMPILVWLVDGSAAGRWSGAWTAGVAGWCFGFGFFVAGLYWIGHAFLVDAKTFGWLLPVAVSGLPAYLAIFTGLALAAARLIWVRGPERILALAAMMTIMEWLRGHVLTGFPWNTFGYALTEPLALAQSVSLIGIWGLTFVTVAVCACPAVLADDRVDTPRPYRTLLVAFLVLAGLTGYGIARLAVHPTTYVAGVKLRIMQPNLQQDVKFNYAAKDQVMARYLALSDRATGPRSKGVADVTHLIWPESAFPFFLAREPDVLAQIAAMLKPGTELITGAVRPAAGASEPRAYNSVYVIDPDGSIHGIYDKVHLVPFGEYLPFQTLLERFGLQQLTKQVGGFLAGGRRRTMDVPGAPKMLPLICYEAIFPGAAVPPGERPGWMVNLTNDGWFGISTGPYQHFQQARVLAIAEGLPLVRAANTGISGVIDPVGRVVQSLPLGVEGVLDSELPKAISPTLFVAFGEYPLILLLVVSLLLVARRRLRS
ncbi:MAG: apolipoprotein N-acyltransferase [Pseudolabrys sp.]|nr:apolipoprotein N-acyltransferase [Pseudolabrys sp.]MDP2294410.1 apolipoprotein N-acyltransferase [Pseudolabrys sp.]